MKNKGRARFKEILETKKEQHREDIAREIKTHGQVRPAEHQVGTKTWKSYSRQRSTSQAYREGFDNITWN